MTVWLSLHSRMTITLYVSYVPFLYLRDIFNIVLETKHVEGNYSDLRCGLHLT